MLFVAILSVFMLLFQGRVTGPTLLLGAKVQNSVF